MTRSNIRKRKATLLAPEHIQEPEQSDFISREAVLSALNIRASSLYTYVSRGLIRSIAQKGSKAHLYSRSDVERIRVKSHAHFGSIARAETAMRWGDPVVSTSITEITADGPTYRGKGAVELANARVNFEAVAHLLWSGDLTFHDLTWNHRSIPFSPDRVFSAFGLTSADPEILKVFGFLVLGIGSSGAGSDELRTGSTIADAQAIVGSLVGACGYLTKHRKFVEPRPQERIAHWLLRSLDAVPSPSAEELINSALVLCADFELASSTFAARVAASAGCDLYSCIGSGLSAHDGTVTGRGGDRLAELLGDAPGEHLTIEARLEKLQTLGKIQLGFNHFLFSEGDPRARLLIDLCRRHRPLPTPAAEAIRFAELAEEKCSAHPGLAVGLAIMALTLRLPRNSTTALWAIARIAGQVAHIIEQRTQGFQLRPRAKFIAK